jgi:hypothetical protein
MEEIYKQFENSNYEVSNLGNIRTIPYNAIKKDGKIHPVRQTNLKPALNKKGYLKVGLTINGKLKSFSVHRIVAVEFLENTFNKPQVNHIDGIKTNNKVDNLEWCNNSENILHSYKIGLTKNIYEPCKDKSNFKRGEEQKYAKLDYNKVSEAKELRKKGFSFQKIADKYSVNKKTIIHAIKGITWNNQNK